MTGRWHPNECKVCGKKRSASDPISAAGYCFEHGNARMEANNTQLHEHRGPHFEHWRKQIAASVGALLLDEDSPTA